MSTGFLKNIHIGSFIKQAIIEKEIELDRICKFMNCSDKEIEEMYNSEDLPAGVLLRWSKLTEYDFFRLYSQYLLLYTSNPAAAKDRKKSDSKLPKFRKSMYSNEIIMFVVEMIESKEMTIPQVIKKYNIGRTTVYKWMAKYSNNEKK